MSGSELRKARGMLDVAEATPAALDRFTAALVAAQVIAALILRLRTARVRPAERNVWQLLLTAAPEFGEWAGFFAECQARQQLAAAGATGIVTARGADDLVRDVRCFHDSVVTWQVRFAAHRAHGVQSGAPA